MLPAGQSCLAWGLLRQELPNSIVSISLTHALQEGKGRKDTTLKGEQRSHAESPHSVHQSVTVDTLGTVSVFFRNILFYWASIERMCMTFNHPQNCLSVVKVQQNANACSWMWAVLYPDKANGSPGSREHICSIEIRRCHIIPVEIRPGLACNSFCWWTAWLCRGTELTELQEQWEQRTEHWRGRWWRADKCQPEEEWKCCNRCSALLEWSNIFEELAKNVEKMMRKKGVLIFMSTSLSTFLGLFMMMLKTKII